MSKEQKFSVGDKIRFLNDCLTHGKKTGDICEIKHVCPPGAIFIYDWAYAIDDDGWWEGHWWEKVEEINIDPSAINKILEE